MNVGEQQREYVIFFLLSYRMRLDPLETQQQHKQTLVAKNLAS